VPNTVSNKKLDIRKHLISFNNKVNWWSYGDVKPYSNSGIERKNILFKILAIGVFLFKRRQR